jgi:rubrerythrin
MFLSLAGMEDGHLQTFQEMRKELSDQEKGGTTFDPYDEAALYLQALADRKGFEGMKSPTEDLTGKESMRELFEIAIEAEKNSVLFYVGLKGMVPAKAGMDKIEVIIREEVRHVAQLRQQLAAVH